MSHVAASTLTRVTLVFVSGQTNIWLRFGHPLYERCIDPVRRQVYFPNDAVLARVHWEGDEFGTTHWSLQILRTVGFNEFAYRIAGVEPGAEVLLALSGPANVRRVLELIDVIEAQRLDPADVSPAYWRTVHNRIAAHQEPPRYDGRTHTAFLTRRSLLS